MAAIKVPWLRARCAVAPLLLQLQLLELLSSAVTPARAELDLLVSDGWPPGWMTLPAGVAVANRLMTASLTEARVARARYNATVFFGSIPDNHAGPAAGVFDR